MDLLEIITDKFKRCGMSHIVEHIQGADIFRPSAEAYLILTEKHGKSFDYYDYQIIAYKYAAGESFTYEVTAQLLGKNDQIVNLAIRVTTEDEYNQAAHKINDCWIALGGLHF